MPADFKNLTKLNRLSHPGLLLSGPWRQGLRQGQPCATTFCWIKSTACLTQQLFSGETPGEHQALTDKALVPPGARHSESPAHI